MVVQSTIFPGLTVRMMCVEEEVCVESSSLRKTLSPFSDVGEWKPRSTPPGRCELHSKGATFASVRRPESAGGQLHRCLPRWSLFRNRVH